MSADTVPDKTDKARHHEPCFHMWINLWKRCIIINNMNIIKKTLPYAAALATPLFAFAQQAFKIVDNVRNLLNQIIPVLLIIGTIVFLWGVIMFLTAGAEEEKRANARSLMIYGLVGLFIMVAIWGIVNVLVGFFGVGGTGVPTSPGQFRGI